MTPEEHAAKAKEMLAASTAVHNQLFERVTSGETVDDQTMLAAIGLTAALAQVHATLSLRADRPQFVLTRERVSGDDLTDGPTGPDMGSSGIYPRGDNDTD
jgi:hypothetical protein